MNVSADLKTYFESNPISNFKNLAENKNWDIVVDTYENTAFYVEGIWKNYLYCFRWMEKKQQLRLTCRYDFNLPKESNNSFYKALNLANEQCGDGFFTFCEHQRNLIFHNQYKGSDALEIEGIRSKEIIAETTSIMDQLYPVFQLISWGKESPDNAIKIAGNHSFGFI